MDLGVIITLIHHFLYRHFSTAQVPTELTEGVGVYQVFSEMFIIERIRECVPFVQLRDKAGTYICILPYVLFSLMFFSLIERFPKNTSTLAAIPCCNGDRQNRLTIGEAYFHDRIVF
jgi:hypothetical protein